MWVIIIRRSCLLIVTKVAAASATSDVKLRLQVAASFAEMRSL